MRKTPGGFAGADRFDDLARGMASGLSRREMMRRVCLVIGAGLVGVLVPRHDASADQVCCEMFGCAGGQQTRRRCVSDRGACRPAQGCTGARVAEGVSCAACV